MYRHYLTELSVFNFCREQGHKKDEGIEEKSVNDDCNSKQRVADVWERPALQMRGCGGETT